MEIKIDVLRVGGGDGGDPQIGMMAVWGLRGRWELDGGMVVGTVEQ